MDNHKILNLINKAFNRFLRFPLSLLFIISLILLLIQQPPFFFLCLNFHFSTFPFFFLERKFIFLVCNGILASLAKNLSRTSPDSTALDNQAEAAAAAAAIIPLLESNVIGHAADQLGTITTTLILEEEMQNYENDQKKKEEEEEEEEEMQNYENEKKKEEEEMQNYENEKKKEEEETDDNGLARETNPVFITDLDDEENGDLMMILGSASTDDQEDITNVDTMGVNTEEEEELNKRIEEFIRKMKEELKIEAQQYSR